jgi:Mg2+/Co2+ transporter CorB
VLHTKDLLRAMATAAGALDGVDLDKIVREPWFIPDTTVLKDQLNAFLKRRTHFALVVDEYGALQGLVTLEDILEEIVGEIDDEYDRTVQGVRRQPDGSVHVDGHVTIRDLNRAMDWNLPDDHAVTIAGLVIHEARAIPEPGQRFVFHGHRFQVLRRQRNQITALRIDPPLPADDRA